MLKEAPCSDMQLAYPGCDFVSLRSETQVVGLGVQPEDLQADEWTRCYGVVTGVAGSDEYSLLSALRAYQSNLRVHKSGRDHMVLLNTWGDRSKTDRLGGAVLHRGAGGRRAGWGSRTSRSTTAGRWASSRRGRRMEGRARIPDRLEPGYRSRQFWAINPERFPNGFAPGGGAREEGRHRVVPVVCARVRRTVTSTGRRTRTC